MKKIVSMLVLFGILLMGTQTNAGAKALKDIEGHWAEDSIRTLADKGIINGKGNGIFDPDGTITVAEFIKLAVTISGYEVDNAEGGDWSAPFIKKAIEVEMIYDGFGDKFGGYHNPINRETMAYIGMYAFSQVDVIGTSVITPEIKQYISDYQGIDGRYRNSVLNSYYIGLLTGKGDNFDPKGTATRAESATMINRILDASMREAFVLDKPYVIAQYDKEHLDELDNKDSVINPPKNNIGELERQVVDIYEYAKDYSNKTKWFVSVNYNPKRDAISITTMNLLKDEFHNLTEEERIDKLEMSFIIYLNDFGKNQYPYNMSFYNINSTDYSEHFLAKHSELWNKLMTILYPRRNESMSFSYLHAIDSNYGALYSEGKSIDNSDGRRFISEGIGNTLLYHITDIEEVK